MYVINVDQCYQHSKKWKKYQDNHFKKSLKEKLSVLVVIQMIVV
jgi:hypothetical protein